MYVEDYLQNCYVWDTVHILGLFKLKFCFS